MERILAPFAGVDKCCAFPRQASACLGSTARRSARQSSLISGGFHRFPTDQKMRLA
jgi:hypothetical protein